MALSRCRCPCSLSWGVMLAGRRALRVSMVAIPPIVRHDARRRRARTSANDVKLCRTPPFEKDDTMTKKVVVLVLTMAAVSALAIGLSGQGTTPERQVVTRAADALGGREHVMAVKTLQIVGY